MPRNIQKPPEFTWMVQQKAAGNEQAWDASILIESSLIIIFYIFFRVSQIHHDGFVRVCKSLEVLLPGGS